MRNGAQKAELDRLIKRHDGLLKPEVVVEAARPASSPLHGSFEWDDGEAAEMWRIEQARHLIRVYVTVVEGSSTESRAFVALSSDRASGGGYRAIVSVLHDEDLRNVLLADALRDMKTFRERYAALNEMAGVMKAMDRVENDRARAA